MNSENKSISVDPLLFIHPNSIIEFINENSIKIEAWFRQQWKTYPAPLYGSVDIRNAGFKLAPVDNNLFPGGFNNLNLNNMPLYVQAMQAAIAEICPQATRLLLIPETHTRNLFYLENVAIIRDILLHAGFEVKIGSLNPTVSQSQNYKLPSEKELLIEPLIVKNNLVGVDNFFPCVIILNNDLSAGIPSFLKESKQLVLPAIELGWTNRLKSKHFRYYQEFCLSFAQMLSIDPWLVMPYFDQCSEVNFKLQTGEECLINTAEQLMTKIKLKYKEYGISHQPFLVVKADQGTYGMAVMMVDQPDQLQHLNRKERTKMSFIKGGKEVTRVIIQEGVHTFETVGKEQAVAEPVLYLIGRHVIGGFYRVHKERGPKENLNSPGMNFEPLAIDKPCHFAKAGSEDHCFYAYGVIARLAQLAAAKELKALSLDEIRSCS